ncbi:hypothetical protein S3A_1714 [Escherichia coli B49-2]|nr:hypothetical protein S3A_1714 [Escherichia coli B49-2]
MPERYIAHQVFRHYVKTHLITSLAQRCKFCRRFQAAKSITKRELSKNAHRK